MSTQQWSEGQILTPTVDQTQEFLEIANDFANPLDIVREGISNAYDAKAKDISIQFDVIQQYGEYVLRITIEDDGEGMGQSGLQAFFDLGNSTRRDQHIQDPTLIGEKGHGTKIFFNSEQVNVTTTDGTTVFHATMEKPFRDLHDRIIPKVTWQERPNGGDFKGTCIQILGYNRNRRDMFSHAQLKDHIQWFTKHGSIERQFTEIAMNAPVLRLKGVDRSEPETIPFGHVFPAESAPVAKLFEQHLADAPQHFSKRWVRQGSLNDYPDIKYEMVFAVEGDRVKRGSNPMLRRSGVTPQPGSYQFKSDMDFGWLKTSYQFNGRTNG